MAKLGVIIANTGSPVAPTSEAVKAYLSEFLTDEHIMPMNPHLWKLILHAFILPVRSKKSAAKYALIWTDKGSPLTVIMDSLARKLEETLIAQGYDVHVRPAASYGSPSIDEVVHVCTDAGCDEIIVVPLYPQSAFSTTSVVENRVGICAAQQGRIIRFAKPYHANSLYLSAIADAVAEAGFGTQPGDKLLFAFHSVPLCDLDNGDSYDKQVEETVHAVVDKLDLKEGDWALGFQCRFDKRRTWLTPFVSEAIAGLEAASPIGRLFVVAPNFSIDCLETLYDIDFELREQYAGELVYVPCLNDSDAQVALLCDHLSSVLN